MEEEAGGQTVDEAGVDSWQLKVEAGPATVERSTAPLDFLPPTTSIYFYLFTLLDQLVTLHNNVYSSYI